MSEEKDPFSEEGTAQPQAEGLPVVQAPAKKIFSRSAIKRFVEVAVHMPDLYPGYEPWVFKLRLKMTKEAEERRQEYLSLSAAQMTVKLQEQALDEIADLLTEMPTGFEDLKDTGQGPGHSFKSYVQTADTEAQELLYQIVEGADNLYWQKISPREFRRAV